MTDDKMMFRGVEVSKDWPEKIRQAQLQPTVRLIVKLPRIRYGREGKRWCSSDRPCHDCAVIAGEFHVPGVRHGEVSGVRRAALDGLRVRMAGTEAVSERTDAANRRTCPARVSAEDSPAPIEAGPLPAHAPIGVRYGSPGPRAAQSLDRFLLRSRPHRRVQRNVT